MSPMLCLFTINILVHLLILHEMGSSEQDLQQMNNKTQPMCPSLGIY